MGERTSHEELQLLPWLRPPPPSFPGSGHISRQVVLQILSLPELCPEWKIKGGQHETNDLKNNLILLNGYLWLKLEANTLKKN